MGRPLLSVSPAMLDVIRARIDAFVAGSEPLTGLDLYLLLERATALLTFHTMLRRGPHNRTRSGLQQSYGDHNRLLLLGLDKIEAGDLAWYRGRLEQPSEIADDELLDCFAAVRGLGLTAPLRIAMWLAATLHDCGMLGGGGPAIDVEDGVELSRDVVGALCPGGLRDLSLFLVRNHDYIKDVFLGEVPVSFIADQREQLVPSLRDVALAALGMVQVAGAASLGDGRLSRFRLEICRRCFDGRVLADGLAGTRLARLLGVSRLGVPQTIRREWDAAIGDGTGQACEMSLRPFLERIPLHGWHRCGVHSDGAAPRSLAILRSIADRYHTDFTHCQRVVLAETDLALAAVSGSRWRLPACTTVEFRNGTKAMLVGGG